MPQGAGYGSKEKKTGSSDPRGGQKSDGSYGGNEAAHNEGGLSGATGSMGTQGGTATKSQSAVERSNTSAGYQDYKGEGDTLGDTFANLVASVFGLDEVNPLEDPNFNPRTQSRANWGWDPVKTAATVGGLFGGIPGTVANMAYNGYRALGGPTMNVNLGPDVFGGDGSAPSAGPGTHGILNGGGKTTRDGGRQTPVQTKTTGILNAPKSPAAPPVVTPTTPPPSPATNPQYPSPDQVFGQSGIGNGYVYDPATGRMIPRPQAAA